MSDSPEGQALMAWQIENPNAPRDWRFLAHRLAQHPDMPNAWAELRKRNESPLAVFSDVCVAFRRANVEVRRLPSTRERDQFERVKSLALQLRDEIEQSPLPERSGRLVGISGMNCADVMLMVGWRNLPDDGFGIAHPLSVVEFLDLVVNMVDIETASLPPRAIERRRKRPLESAFVRWLTFLFLQRFGEEMHATVARITSAVLDLADPLDKKDVEAFLKDSPPEFRTILSRKSDAP